MTPRISILLPTYNRAGLLPRAVQSVLQQNCRDWELIIVDDASTDHTAELIHCWVNEDPRIQLIRNAQNQFTAACLNSALAAARGEYIARLDDDDYWIDPDKLTRQLNFLQDHSAYVVVGGGVVVIDSDNRELYRYYKRENDAEIRSAILLANPFTHTTVMFRASVARAVGGYGKDQYAEDWALWLKMGLKGKLHNMHHYFTAYMMNSANNSFRLQRQQSRDVLKMILQYRRDYAHAFRAIALNGMQYLYSYIPESARRSLHRRLVVWKRRAF